MVVWFAHVRVGHRQLPIPKHPLYSFKGGVFIVKITCSIMMLVLFFLYAALITYLLHSFTHFHTVNF